MEQYLNELNGKNILITGRAGFMGAHFIDRLSPQKRRGEVDRRFADIVEFAEARKEVRGEWRATSTGHRWGWLYRQSPCGALA